MHIEDICHSIFKSVDRDLSSESAPGVGFLLDACIQMSILVLPHKCLRTFMFVSDRTLREFSTSITEE